MERAHRALDPALCTTPADGSQAVHDLRPDPLLPFDPPTNRGEADPVVLEVEAERVHVVAGPVPAFAVPRGQRLLFAGEGRDRLDGHVMPVPHRATFLPLAQPGDAHDPSRSVQGTAAQRSGAVAGLGGRRCHDRRDQRQEDSSRGGSDAGPRESASRPHVDVSAGIPWPRGLVSSALRCARGGGRTQRQTTSTFPSTPRLSPGTAGRKRRPDLEVCDGLGRQPPLSGPPDHPRRSSRVPR